MTKEQSFKLLDSVGAFEYGTTIKTETILNAFGVKQIVYPATKEDIQRYELSELTITGYIRDKLLNSGKYLKGERDSYRVLLPSENAGQVVSYMNSADNKLKRGLKLNNNTPSEYKITSNDEVRAIMKRENCKDEKRRFKDASSG